MLFLPICFLTTLSSAKRVDHAAIQAAYGSLSSRSLSSSNSTTFTGDTTFENACLNSTNVIRSEHGASSLAWNTTLSTYAQTWSSQCQFRPSLGPFGENIVAGEADVTSSINEWIEPGLQISFDNMTIADLDPEILQFTQLVWKNSTQLGCGRTDCAGQNGVSGWLVVCEFSPRGNILGEFQTNVQLNSTSNGKSGVIGESDEGDSKTGGGAIEEGKTSDGADGGNGAMWSVVAGLGVAMVALVIL